MFGMYNFIDANTYTGRDKVERTTIYLHDVENHRVDQYTVDYPVRPFDFGDQVICDLELVRTKDNAFVVLRDINKREVKQ